MPGPRRTLKRIEAPHHGRFLTFSCYQRRMLFQNDSIKDAFAAELAKVRQAMGFRLFAWVVMPEHVHLLLRTAEPGVTVPAVLTRLKSAFAQRTLGRWRQLDAPILNRLVDQAGRTRFWQPGGGYDRNLTSAERCVAAAEYMHQNPVRRGLVRVATDYPWSSARAWAGLDVTGLVPDPLT
jgi:putative transposase